MSAVPVGGLLLTCIALLAVAPIRRPRNLALASWISTIGPNELPLHFAALVVATSLPSHLDGAMDTRDWISLALTVITAAAFLVVAWRTTKARAAPRQALDDVIGSVRPRSARRRGLPWARMVLMPWPFRPRDVEKIADVAYADGGRHNHLDVYRHRSRPTGAPTLIHLHGGGSPGATRATKPVPFSTTWLGRAGRAPVRTTPSARLRGPPSLPTSSM